MLEILEIISPLFISISIYFLILVFHNKQKFSFKTFFKVSVRVLGFFVILMATVFALKPFLSNVYDQAIILGVVAFITIKLFYTKDYEDEEK
jgi:hypothetical protein